MARNEHTTPAPPMRIADHPAARSGRYSCAGSLVIRMSLAPRRPHAVHMALDRRSSRGCQGSSGSLTVATWPHSHSKLAHCGSCFRDSMSSADQRSPRASSGNDDARRYGCSCHFSPRSGCQVTGSGDCGCARPQTVCRHMEPNGWKTSAWREAESANSCARRVL